MGQQSLQYWTVWYPQAASTGLLLARGKLKAADALLLHAAPGVITVEVSDSQGNRIAYGQDLQQTQSSPICRLQREGKRILREDIWPVAGDLGALVLLPGGEVGTLTAWWHAEDKQEWRWQIELYNSRR